MSNAHPSLRVGQEFLTCLLFMQAIVFVLIGIAQPAAAQVIYNVRNYGAIPNNGTSDHNGIQAAINAAQQTPNSTVYFPRGTYLAGDLQIINSTLGLTLAGDGQTQSFLKRLPGAGRQGTVENSTDIVIRDLAWNADAIKRFGGVAFYDTKRVTIHNTRFYDSRKQPLGGEDRFSYIFSGGSQPHETIRIQDNLIEDLQLEVDYAHDVRIERNTVQRPVMTAGIGTFSLSDGGVAEDFYIVANTIIDPNVTGGAISVHLDPPNTNNNLFRNIHIENNLIRYTRALRGTSLAPAVRLGTGNNSVATLGNIFDGISVVNNEIQVACSQRLDFDEAIIFGANSRGPDLVVDFLFTNLTITDNAFFYGGFQPLLRVDGVDLNYVAERNTKLPCWR